MILWIILAAIAAVAMAPFVRERFRPDLKRNVAPGDFADLPTGRTHYQWLGAKEGPIAVCVHGLTTPSFVWGPIAERLGDLGFRVLVYDLYGRGYSDRVPGLQDTAFFNAQLDGLLGHLEVDETFTLLGYSMGGAVAAGYAAQNHDRLRQLCLIAPAGFGHDLGPIVDVAVKYNWFGRWMMLGLYPRSLRQATEAERGLPSAIQNMVDLQIAESQKRGFAPAVLSSLRGLMSEDLEPAMRAVSKAGLPVLAIWGQDDEIIPISGMGTLAEWNRSARQEIIDGADHTLTYTDVDALASKLELMRR